MKTQFLSVHAKQHLFRYSLSGLKKGFAVGTLVIACEEELNEALARQN